MITEVDDRNLTQAAEVHSVSWRESHRSFCTPEFVALHTPERQRDYIRGKMEAGSRFFLLTKDAPVGIVSVKGSLIEDLYVLPEAQGKGLGTQLLRYAAARCEGAPELWILENNEKAARLYRREGFRETGNVRRTPGGLDEIEMSLKEERK